MKQVVYNKGVSSILKALDFPERITIELTNRCNLECTFCPRHLVSMEYGNMEEEIYKKIVDEASEHLPVAVTVFFRGESLLHPKLPEMIRYAKENKIGPVQLASNGFLLSAELGKEILDAGLDFISFSLDTIDSQIYRKTRLNSDLTIAMNNVLAFVSLCEERKRLGQKVPEIQVSSVDVDDYAASKEQFISFWKSKVDRVRIYQEHSKDGNLGSLSKEDKEHSFQRKPCGKVYSDMVIYWDGTVALCNHDWETKANLPTVKENSIKSIWKSEAYQAIRTMHETGKFEEKLACAHCDHWQMYYRTEKLFGEVYEKGSGLTL